MPQTAPNLSFAPPALIRPAWVVGFIGQRSGLDESALRPVVEAALTQLRDEVAAEGGALHFYSSVADGADLLALDVAERLALPLHVVLPLPEDEFFRPFLSSEARARARRRLAAIRTQPGRHTWRVAPTSMQLPDAYFEADTLIVEACDVLLVVWDGQPETGLGGTAQLVNRARARRCPIVWIHKVTATIVREKFPAHWPVVDAKLDFFARSGAVRLGGDDAALATPGETAKTLKKNLSALAKADAKWFRRAIFWVGVLSAGAALCGLSAGLIPHDTPAQRGAGMAFYFLEYVLLVWVVVFKWHDRRKEVRDEWIDARFGAELYRAIHASQPVLDPLHPPVAALRPEWRRFVLTLGLLLHAAKAPSFQLVHFRTDYSKGRMHDQARHFRKQARASARWARWCGRLGGLSMGLSATVLLIAYLNRALEWELNTQAGGMIVVGVLPVLFPLVANLLSSLALLLDHDRRAGRYPALRRKLVLRRRELRHQHTLGSVRQFVSATEAMLLDELLEWYAVTSRADPN